MTLPYLIVQIDLALSLNPEAPLKKRMFIVNKVKEEIYSLISDRANQSKDNKKYEKILEMAAKEEDSYEEILKTLEKIQDKMWEL